MCGKNKRDNCFFFYLVLILEIDLWRVFLRIMEKGNWLVYIYWFIVKNVKFFFCFIVFKVNFICVGYLGKLLERLLIKSLFVFI